MPRWLSKPGKPAVATKKGGGYYLDDGPGDNPPANLDAIPDAEPKAEPLHKAANRPYSVLGQSYTPDTRLKPYKETGVASWYGRRYHGQKTSTGEIYDMYGMTAAHPTLPIPSYVRVTNLKNGKSVVVRVNDRGPFHSDRLIDLVLYRRLQAGRARWRQHPGRGGSDRPSQLLPPQPGEAPALLRQPWLRCACRKCCSRIAPAGDRHS